MSGAGQTSWTGQPTPPYPGQPNWNAPPNWTGRPSWQPMQQLPQAGGWHPYAAVKPGVIPLRPLGVGEILDGAFSTIRSRPAMMLGFAAVIVIITQLIVVALTYPLLDDVNQVANDPNLTDSELIDAGLAGLAVSGITLAVTIVYRVLLSGFVTVVVGTAVLGQSIGFAAVWERVRPRLLSLLGMTLIYPAVLVGVSVVLVMLAVVAAPLAVLLGLAVVVVGIWLLVMFSLATPALMLENAGVGQAFGRSRLLTRDSWWRIFGITLLAWVITFIIALIITLPFEIFGGGFNNGFATAPTGTYLLVSTIGIIIASTVTEPFIAAVTVLLYTDQRMRREGLDIMLARAAGGPPPQRW